MSLLPPFASNQSIGLLGGSFNPPHQGHVLATQQALVRARLDRIWWLVTPGNPLKNPQELADMRLRIVSAKALVQNPRIVMTGFEREIGVRYTIDTLHYIKQRAPNTRFVWIMGADNWAQFHLWRDWRDIADLVPMLIIDRPGSSFAAVSAHASQVLAQRRWREGSVRDIAFAKPPAWTFLHALRCNASSTALRALQAAKARADEEGDM